MRPPSDARPPKTRTPTAIAASGTAMVASATGLKCENERIPPSRSSSTPMPNQPPATESSARSASGNHMLGRENPA